MSRFRALFPHLRTNVIGMIHLGALPGTPAHNLSMNQLVERASQEARLYAQVGIDGVIIENMNDLPYMLARDLGPEIVASMSVIAHSVREEIPAQISVGIQVLAGGNHEALAVALASGCQFIRAEGFVFGHVADEGWMQPGAGKLLRYRKSLQSADDIAIFCDIKKKHSAHAVTQDVSIAETAEAAKFFLSDGVIVTGSSTGQETNLKELEEVLDAAKEDMAVLVGSGVTDKNIGSYANAHGLIIGSSFKKEGHWRNELDPKRIEKVIGLASDLRQSHVA